MNEYTALLREWVECQWSKLSLVDVIDSSKSNSLGECAPKWQALSGDAGFRRYFRLASRPSLLAVFAPPETEDMTAFIDIAHHLRVHGVRVPAIVAFDKMQGFLLIEDLGTSLLFNQLNAGSVDGLYGNALQSLLKIQQSPLDQAVFPQYSSEKLLAEMGLFKQWFVPRLLGYQFSDAESQMIDDWFLLLAESATAQPQVVVHRDYHSRNLIYREMGLPGVIDFQDAVIGPITYDLVSLLRDCYIRWSDEQVKGWALEYLNLAKTNKLVDSVTETQFLQWFDWMGLQRHIKVLGIFARLSLRDGKHGYLNDLPLVIDYVLRVAKLYPQSADFVQWFEQKLMPLIAEQPWYYSSNVKLS